MEELVDSINKLSLYYHDRNDGVQNIFVELLLHINQRPIAFTVSGFYVIDKTFAATVKNCNYSPTII